MTSDASIILSALLLLLGAGYPAQGQRCASLPPDAVAWWSFDETQGTIAQDRLGAHHGSHAKGPTSVDGIVRGALSFDGRNDHLTISDHGHWTLGRDDFTIELWANFLAPGGSVGHPGDIFIGHDDGPGTRKKWFFALGGGVLNFHVNGPGIGAQFFPLVPFTPVLGEWYHLAVVRRVDTFTIFVNGEARGAATRPIVIPDASAPLTIGQAENLGYMNGSLDEVTIYHRALEGAELLAIVNAGPAGKCIDLEMRPNHGGNGGIVSTRIQGPAFAAGTTLRLARIGEADIVGRDTAVEDRGTALVTAFDLRGSIPGQWDVVVDHPDGSSQVLEGAFTVEPGGESELYVDIVGLPLARPGRPQRFHVIVGNRGNLDAFDAYLRVKAPSSVALSVETLRIEDPMVDYGAIPSAFEKDGFNVAPVWMLRIPAGSTTSVEVSLTVSGDVGTEVPLEAEITQVPSTFAASGDIEDIEESPTFENIVQATIDALSHQAEPPSDAIVRSELSRGVRLWNQLLPVYAGIGVGIGSSLGWAFTQPLLGAVIGGTVGTLVAGGLLAHDYYMDRIFDSVEYLKRSTAELRVGIVGSFDPNDKSGSQGFGEARYVSGEEPLRYAVRFENMETATAPAQIACIEDRLDLETIDLDSFSLGPISFGETVVRPPTGAQSFVTEVDLRPQNDLLVRIVAHLDRNTGLLTWSFRSIDPATGDLPTDPRVGFLPPNTSPPEGDGSVLFTVKARSGLSTGTEVRNKATIVFDVNDAIETPEWKNTLDTERPASEVLALPETVGCDGRFLVEWSGADEGSGIGDYSIFVSENDGPFTVWLQNTRATDATFQGRSGAVYGFYSVARDHTGNTETAAPTPDAMTQVLPLSLAGNVNVLGGSPENVLLVNGAPGDETRRIRLRPGERMEISLRSSSAGPPGRFALWVWSGEPLRPQELRARGHVLGCVANPTPIQVRQAPQPFRCIGSEGLPPALYGDVIRLAWDIPQTTPWTWTIPQGTMMPGVHTLQALVEDAGSGNASGFSMSNAVIVVVQ